MTREPNRWPQQLVIFIPFCGSPSFSLVPFLIVLKISLSQTAIAQPPYTPVLDLPAGWDGFKNFVAGLSLDNYVSLRSDPIYLLSYLKSLEIAALSTLLLLLIGYPIAYGMARMPQRLQALLVLLVMLPFWTSFLIRIYAWMNILQRDGPAQSGAAWRCASSTSRRCGSRPTPRSISASSIPTCRSWCCRSTRRWRRWTSRCSRPPPISAARAGRRSGW